MKKELGKWLMDVAKYVATAIIITSAFRNTEPSITYVGGAITVLITLFIGITLYSGKSFNEVFNYITGKIK